MRSSTWACLVLVMGLSNVACGGDVTGTNGGAIGSSGTAGSSSSGGAGSAASMHPSSQGSASIHFQGPSMEATAMGKQCPVGVHYADAPTAFTPDQRTTGATRPKDTIVDGEQSRQFKCAVVPTGGKFAISGEINVPAFDKDNNPLPTPTQIRLATTIGKDESGTTGSLSVADDATAGIFYQSAACTFSVRFDTLTQSTRVGIDAGKAWGSVVCPTFEDPKDPSSSCTVDVGYFILENCDQ